MYWFLWQNLFFYSCLSMQIFVYTHVYTYTSMKIHSHNYTHINNHTHTHARVHKYIYICVCVCVCVVSSISFQTFFVWAFKIAVDSSVCYCYTFYKMTDQFLWFQIQMNSYSSNWNRPYQSLIIKGGEFQKCNLDFRKMTCNKILF